MLYNVPGFIYDISLAHQIYILLNDRRFFLCGLGTVKRTYGKFCEALQAGEGLAERVRNQGWK